MITVAQAPTEVPPNSVAESPVVTKSADKKVETKDTLHPQHAEVKKSVAASEMVQDEVHSETAPPVKSAPLPK